MSNLQIGRSTYKTSLVACTTAGVEIAAVNKDRNTLTIWNHDAANAVNIHLGDDAASYIPLAAGKGLDIKPAPINKVTGTGDGGTVNVTVWES